MESTCTARHCCCAWFYHVVLLLNRIMIGILLINAGYGKVHMGADAWMGMYQGMVPPWLPKWFALPYGHAVPWLEMLTGCAVLVGLLGRWAAAGLFLMITSFTIALIQKSGQFSGGERGIFHSNMYLMGLILLLAVTGPGKFSLDHLLGRWIKLPCCCCTPRKNGDKPVA